MSVNPFGEMGEQNVGSTRTQQATFEASNLIMGFSPEIYVDSCYNDYYDIFFWVVV